MKRFRSAATVLVASLMLVCMLFACGCSAQSNDSGSQPANQQEAGSSSTATTAGSASTTNAVFDEDALVSSTVSKFEQKTYEDADTGKSVTYNLFLPDSYDASKSYPMVVFIADSSCTGDDATRSLNQGLGALVWASDQWQAEHECIVCVPTYPETILDDNNSYTTTEYVELTKRLIDTVSSEYAVDTGRIYGTGQSMGCMTTLILASEYPDLYAACMFVDGQWDVSALKGLEGQKFVYFAAEDDAKAYAGMQEVMAMYDSDKAAYTYQQWDGSYSADELTSAAEQLFGGGTDANFVSWKTGTIDASSAAVGGGQGGMHQGDAGQRGPKADAQSSTQDKTGNGNAQGGNAQAGNAQRGGGSAHMASFDYAYNCVSVMEWLFQQG